jgi:K+-sensing histidine kinase KdpD
MEVKLVKDTLIVEITDTTSSLSKYQKETLFHGFIHNDVMTDQKSLIMPIAKGLSMSLGGNLEIIDSSKGKTVYRFKIMTKDSD